MRAVLPLHRCTAVLFVAWALSAPAGARAQQAAVESDVTTVDARMDRVTTLLTQRAALADEDPQRPDLEAEIVDLLTQVVAETREVTVLHRVRDAIGTSFARVRVAAARKVLDVTPEPAGEAYRDLARALYFATIERGPSPALEEAEAAAMRAVTMGEGRIAADVSLLADIQAHAGKTAQAYDNYLKAAELAKGGSAAVTAAAFMDLFRFTRDRGRHEEADRWFGQAAATFDLHAYDWAEYGRFLDELSRHEEAGRAWLAAYERRPSYWYACDAGESFASGGAGADRVLQTVRQCLDGAVAGGNRVRTARAHRMLADTLIQTGPYDEAIDHAREALAINPDDPFAHHLVARAQVHLGRFGDAMASVSAAIRLSDGAYSAMYFTLGMAHFGLEQWPEATRAFLKAAELRPDDSASAYNVAVSLQNFEYYPDAEAWYREALRRDPHRADRVDILHRIERIAGR